MLMLKRFINVHVKSRSLWQAVLVNLQKDKRLKLKRNAFVPFSCTSYTVLTHLYLPALRRIIYVIMYTLVCG